MFRLWANFWFMAERVVLQIVPRISDIPDGVTDYALNLAKALLTNYDLRTVFATAERSRVSEHRLAACAPSGFLTRSRRSGQQHSLEVVSLEDVGVRAANATHVILHYVNYGYQKRGLPFSLVSTLRRLCQNCRGRVLVIFHELFASGPPWKSEFWLEAWQKKIARDVAQLADARLVSSESMREMLGHVAPGLNAIVHPIPSAFGEPVIDLAQLRARDNQRWLICGGTQVIERSLRSLLQLINAAPHEVAPKELLVVGGTENKHVRQMLNTLPNVRSEYYPAVSAEKASQILSTCAFGWLDYFTSRNANSDLLLKSSSFANICANAVVCVLPQASGPISLAGDALPGPFTIARDEIKLPSAGDRPVVGHAIYEWYHRHASIVSLAQMVAEKLA